MSATTDHRPSAFGRAHSLHRRQSQTACTLHQKAGGVGKVQRCWPSGEEGTAAALFRPGRLRRPSRCMRATSPRTGSSLSPSCAAIRLTVGWSSRWLRNPKLDKCVFFWTSVATPSCCIWRNPLPRPSSGSRGRAIAMRGSRPSVPRMAIGQGRRILPPEPSHRPRGPAARGPLIQHQPVPRICAGHQRLHPQ
jgi:hypothetical protein